MSENEDFLIPNNLYDRIKKDNPTLINPPSNVIHVSNINKITNIKDLTMFFEKYATPLEIKL